MGASWQQLVARLCRHGCDVAGTRVLDIGCGSFHPYTLLMGAAGAWAVGGDTEPLVRAGVHGARFRRFRAESPAVRACVRFAYDVCRQAVYYGSLRRAAAAPLCARDAHLVRLDGSRTPFADAAFDVCVSSAAFEHMEDVPATVREIARILRPGGFADVHIHLFASLTGGHDPVLYDRAVPPSHFRLWGHLYDPEWTPPVPLNRWRESQFRAAFERSFTIVERTIASTCGASQLTDDIRARLPGFDREELITESVIYVLQRTN